MNLIVAEIAHNLTGYVFLALSVACIAAGGHTGNSALLKYGGEIGAAALLAFQRRTVTPDPK